MNCLVFNFSLYRFTSFLSHVQPHSSGAASGGHPGGADQTLPGHEQRGLPVHVGESGVCARCESRLRFQWQLSADKMLVS